MRAQPLEVVVVVVDILVAVDVVDVVVVVEQLVLGEVDFVLVQLRQRRVARQMDQRVASLT
jgi:hypothetical protein